ncbi:MAG TPA: RDD family protein, partial [Acidobacteriaceae bacterium]|nr:RDD family protein [Acidobacteriaceae bacterium]
MAIHSIDPPPPRAAQLAPGHQLSIHTPELVSIEFPLAGLGSRFVAILLDYLLQGVLVLLSILIFFVFLSGVTSHIAGTVSDSQSAKWGIAIVIAIPFLLQWGYFTLFEAFWRGQTPGKRVMRIRVIQQTGRQVSLIESMGRNLVRVVDWLPAFYIVGVISLFVTRRQQRLGDLIAGTLVVHERQLETPLESIGLSRTFTASVLKPTAPAPPRESKLPADKVARLTLADLQ